MSQVSFGNIAADMRLESSEFGIPTLQGFFTFLDAFAPVSVQTTIANATTIQIVERDAANRSIVVTVSGNIPALALTSVQVAANGVTFEYTGSFTIDAYGNDIYGTVTGESARLTNGGALLASVAGTSFHFSLAADMRFVLNGPVDLAGNDSVSAGSGNDYLLGYAGADTINGGAGNDTLDGGSGNDTLAGDAGNDTYIVDSGADVLVENSGAGLDSVLSAVSHTLTANLENLSLSAGGALAGSGNDLNNSIAGNAGDNTLDGAGGRDTLSGGAGNDTYVVDEANDVVLENADAGADTVRSLASFTLGANLETLVLVGTAAISGVGNAADNRLTGNDGANSLQGGSGNDTLDGGAGADTLAGGAGNDTYVVDNANEVVSESTGQGSDTVQVAVSYTLAGGIENLTLTGLADVDGTGDALANVLIGNSGNNTLVSAGGNDTLDGGIGSDTVRLSGNQAAWSTPVITGTRATITRIGTLESVTVQRVEWLRFDDATVALVLPQRLDDPIAGGHAIGGAAGNDTIDGLDGADTMQGGAGDDHYYVDNAGDVVSEKPNEGSDTVLASVSIAALAANLEKLTLTGSSAIDGGGNALDNVLTGNAGNNRLDGGAGFDTLNGGAGNDVFVVDSTTDVIVDSAGIDRIESSLSFSLAGRPIEDLTLIGSAANGSGNNLGNSLLGNAADNLLDGRGGVDTLAGGAGNDAYVVDNAGDVVIEGLGQGTDSVKSSASYTLSTNVENLTLIGAASIDATGNTLSNTLVGNSGDNMLTGGAGNDTYVLGGAGDRAVEVTNEGTDTVFTSAAYTLGVNLENLTLSGSANVNGAGNAGDNVIVGNVGNNRLNGLSGSDSLAGGAGNDTLNGSGGGIDTLEGGAGNDVYVVSNGLLPGVEQKFDASLDLFFEGAPYDSFTTGPGTWRITPLDFTRDGLTDYLRIDYSEGTRYWRDFGLALATYGLDRNLKAGTYLDAVDAGYSVSGHPGLDFSHGNTVDYTLSGSFTIQDIRIDYLDPFSPRLVYLDATFSLPGDMQGVIHYALESPILIRESPGEGSDTVRSALSYTLGANVENLVLTGLGGIDGGGNELDNRLSGNPVNNVLDGGAGADVLDGGKGSDTMLGGVGDDSYYVDSGSDVVIDSLNEGNDTEFSSVSVSGLAENIENLTLLGTAMNGTGNALDNVLTGNARSNRLAGGAGIDTLVGGAGNDVYVVDTTNDEISDSAGTDWVNSSVSFSLAALTTIENLRLTGAGPIDGTGNELDNRLIGNTGDNLLAGGAGADILNGNTGQDTMLGGLGDDLYCFSTGDVVVENPGEGNDYIASSVDVTLPANVENLIVEGDGMRGAGNSLDNVLENRQAGRAVMDGMDGNDVLIGHLTSDVSIGGNGADVFVISRIGGAYNERSIIADFRSSEGDRIDLSALDADSTIAGDQAFATLIVGDSVSGGFAGPGELYYDPTTQTLYMNTYGNSDAEYVLQCNGVASFSVSDFIL